MREGDRDYSQILQTIDLEQELNDQKVDPVALTEGDRLLFARQILMWLVIVTVFSFSAYILAPGNQGAAEVFELIKVGVLPLVTLVIGFYFPNSRK